MENERLSVIVGEMGAQGDGEVKSGFGVHHVPYVLPGEKADIEVVKNRVKLCSIEVASADRREPICKHFGTCGACSLQHWHDVPYLAWKAGIITRALEREGIEAPSFAIKSYPVASRRRAVLTGAWIDGGFRLGFRGARSDKIVDMDECPILLPELFATVAKMKRALSSVIKPGAEARIHVTAADNGIDCHVAGAPLAASMLRRVVTAFAECGLLRLSWNDALLFANASPSVSFSGVAVQLPPLAFLQAIKAAENDMADFALACFDTMGKADRIFDLFSGVGALAFPLAKKAPVTAYELDGACVAAADLASTRAQGLKPFKALRRDLFRNPLSPRELAGGTGIMIDPPFHGAESQCKAIATSKVAKVVMFSCNPATFARDASLLIGGGYALQRIAGFDQFRFSSHVEMGGLFVRSV